MKETSRVWWYVLAGEFGARQWVGEYPVLREVALLEIAAEQQCPGDWIAQCWPFRKSEDTYNKAIYKRR